MHTQTYAQCGGKQVLIGELTTAVERKVGGQTCRPLFRAQHHLLRQNLTSAALAARRVQD